MTETQDDDDDDNETYKKQLLDQLEKKVEEKSKWSWKSLLLFNFASGDDLDLVFFFSACGL